MRVRSLLSAAIFLLILAASGAAQEKSNVTVTKRPAPHTSPASGEEMYVNYCASCHGRDAKGNGPAAAALKAAPTDLTQLAKQNGGKFPADHVATILAGGDVAAHGSSDMPVWGPVFRRLSTQHQSEVQQRISNLTKYLESLQTK